MNCYGSERSAGALMKPRVEPVAPPLAQPGWREIIVAFARSQDIETSSEWVDRLVGGAKAAETRDDAINYLEREFDRYNLASLDKAIARHAVEVRRLRDHRRRMAKRIAAESAE